MTLDPDTALLVRQRMDERKVSFKQALNDAIREGADRHDRTAFRTATARMGRPKIDLDRASQVAASLDDLELAHRWTSEP